MVASRLMNPLARKRVSPFIEYLLSAQGAAGQFVRPSMHRLMLEDFYRTLSFRNALLVNVRPGMHVLDIGTGTGVLAHFALEAGAAHVTTVESTPFARLARKILAANGLQDRITVIEAMSFDIELEHKADLLVTETLGHIAYDEGILDTAFDARQRLLKPTAPILPGSFEIHAAPVLATGFSEALAFWGSEQFGLSMEVVNGQLVHTAHVARLRDVDFLGEPTRVIHAVVGDTPAFPLTGQTCLKVTQPGVSYGLALSFQAALGQLSLLSRSAPSWQDVFLPFLTPLSLNKDEDLQITLSLEKPSEHGVLRGQAHGFVVQDRARAFIVDVTGVHPGLNA